MTGVLDGIAADTGRPVLSLPLIEQYHIDLGFDLCNGIKGRPTAGSFDAPAAHRRRTAPGGGVAAGTAPGDATVRHCRRPGGNEREPKCWTRSPAGWRRASSSASAWSSATMSSASRPTPWWCSTCPTSWWPTTGAHLAREQGVTLCYRRQRHLPEWPYNLYCMVHGRSREEVMPIIERLCRVAGHPCEVLFSTRRFKQQGARYFDGR